MERPAVSLAYTEVEAAMTANLDQLDRTKMGINEKDFITGELAPVVICSWLTYAPLPREASIPTETVAAPETTEATTPLRAGAEDGAMKYTFLLQLRY